TPKMRAVMARRLHAQLGWSQATIAEVFKVPGPAVSKLFTQWAGDIPEIVAADGTKYPARGKSAEPDKQVNPAKPAAAKQTPVNSVGEALKVLYSDYLAVNQ